MQSAEPNGSRHDVPRDIALEAFATPAPGHATGAAAPAGAPVPLLDPDLCARARGEIAAWDGYEPTPLVPLPSLCHALGLGTLHYKDEGLRFGLESFKALGGAWAVLHVLRDVVAERTGRAPAFADVRNGNVQDATRDIVMVTATDGNHGRAVAWGARQFGCKAKIYMHAHVSESRADAVRSLGAEVVRVNGTYDDSVARAAADAARHRWVVVADTSYGSYAAIPRLVMAGYTTLVAEALAQLGEEAPTHVFVPGGVGGLAAAVCSHLRTALPQLAVRVVIVEPERAPCLYESARRGRRTVVPVEEETVMAGLSCGEPSELAWPILAACASDFLTVPDAWVAPAMRLLARSPFGDPPIVAGESAVAGLCGLLGASAHADVAAALGLSRSSRVLLLGTEGATDPAIYRQMSGCDPDRVRST